MFLKISTKNIEHHRRQIEFTECTASETNNGEKVILLFTTSKKHKLLEGDRLFFKNNSIVCKSYNAIIPSFYDNGDVIEFQESCWNTNSEGETTFYEKGLYIKENNKYRRLTNEEVEKYYLQLYSCYDDNLVVVGENLTPTTFQVEVNKYIPLPIKEITDTEDKTYAYPYKEMNFNLTSGELLPIYEMVNGAFYTISNCYFLNKHAFVSPLGYISDNTTYYVLDKRFIDYNDSENRLTPVFKNDILVYEYTESLNISLPFSEQTTNSIGNEDSINVYFKEKRTSLIPDIIDYEKKCFTPTYYNSSTKQYNFVTEMEFNLFFRDRTGSDEWMTADNKGWNLYKMEDNGIFSTPTIKNGDLIGVLNFTDDDIYYRKQKVSKTFIRLSFYDSIDPTYQMLLYYSTIFLDSAELYDKYISYFRETPASSGKDLNLVNHETNNSNRLGIQFHVKDKYDRNKSSEGFYLYLFPDGLRENDTNTSNIGDWDYNTYSSVERTIYMKIEFNHAGYGRTIPMMYPIDKSGNILSFTSSNFPKSFNGNWKACNESMYIPVKIKYDSVNNDFIYYFPYCTRNNNKLVFNLYEPRLNNLE